MRFQEQKPVLLKQGDGLEVQLRGIHVGAHQINPVFQRTAADLYGNQRSVTVENINFIPRFQISLSVERFKALRLQRADCLFDKSALGFRAIQKA